ncbi:MAG: hypothetical protein MZV65_50440 [Chromatiales bacterium]|nr:hypothetical protein [Chromatiales bacterium]
MRIATFRTSPAAVSERSQQVGFHPNRSDAGRPGIRTDPNAAQPRHRVRAAVGFHQHLFPLRAETSHNLPIEDVLLHGNEQLVDRAIQVRDERGGSGFEQPHHLVGDLSHEVAARNQFQVQALELVNRIGL